MRKMGTLFAIVAMTIGLTAPAVANNGNGQGNAPERGNTSETLGFHENADPLAIEEVRPEVADPTRGNFDEQFIYYRVLHEEVTYSNRLYRETSRLDGNFEFGEGTSDRFWFGVSGPDTSGVQHEIVHDGVAVQYFREANAWRSLTASFSENDFGHGLLTDVNGEGPNGVFGDVSWSPSTGPNEGDEIRSTFSTAQGRVVTTNATKETVQSIEVDCTRIDGDEVFLGGTNQDGDPVVIYIRGGDNPAFNQWANSPHGKDCEAGWNSPSTFNEGFIEFGS